jgi:hypothetical protein
MSNKIERNPLIDRRKPREKNRPKDYGWTLYLIIITSMLAVGFLVSYDGLFKPGDDIGYNLGLAGGVMMLILLTYPLRKRISFLNNIGILPTWFRWHMVLGILGPTFIMFHSTFKIGSINAGVAMTCMMLVSGSGIFGRFFYTKIHHGLYGRQANFKQLKGDLEGSGDVKSALDFVPHIQKTLTEFSVTAMNPSLSGLRKLWNFATLAIRVPWLSKRLIRDLEDAMYADANEKQWDEAQINLVDKMFFENKKLVESYLKSIRDIAQFETYEKLFSLWHIFHIPLVYMLIFSGIWHVIAVHMY